jgi:hypothetical protein
MLSWRSRSPSHIDALFKYKCNLSRKGIEGKEKRKKKHENMKTPQVTTADRQHNLLLLKSPIFLLVCLVFIIKDQQPQQWSRIYRCTTTAAAAVHTR